MRVRGPITGWLLIAALLVLWGVLASYSLIDQRLLPGPTALFTEFVHLVRDGTIATDLAATMTRTLSGLAIAFVLSLALGMTAGLFRKLEYLIRPSLELLRPIPAPAYIPVVILFLGIGEQMKISVVALAAFFPMYIAVLDGVRNVDPTLVKTARSFGLSDHRILLGVVLPSIVPQILTGTRIALAVALIVTIVSEMLASNSGLGFLILKAQRMFDASEMYVGILCLGLTGYLLNSLLHLVERLLLKRFYW
jgi:ABC-type nitrate/sulfonate/bicarbonate transport system permease component